MKPIYHYSTVAEALKELNKNGFTYDFNLHAGEIKKNPTHYEIKHIYRYEGNTDPDEEATVYGIESVSGKKGVFVTGYSANSNDDVDQVLDNLSIN